MSGILYLVATPIGNLNDISMRALETLRSADLIACEDTRHTGKLLKHFEISKKLVSFHAHNEEAKSAELIALLKKGRSIALVTDAGTPGISDPGFSIVRKAHENGVKVTTIPGAAAFVNAVVISGLPTDSIFFGGFLPSKKGERRKRLTKVKEIPATLVFYETPHRIKRSLVDCYEILGNREAAVVRELTKIHEEVLRDDLKHLSEYFSKNQAKGEIVLVIDRSEFVSADTPNTDSQALADRVKILEKTGLDRKKALKTAAKEFGISRSGAYRMLQSEE